MVTKNRALSPVAGGRNRGIAAVECCRVIAARAGAFGAVLLCAGLAACASTESASTATQSGSRLSDIFATPDWAKFTGAERKTATRATTPEDLVSAEGACAGGGTQTTALANSDGSADAPAAPAQPAIAGGIALQMTECEVVHRAGFPQRVEIGAGPGGERTAKITYNTGPWPGLYTFNAGRLVSIDRVEVVEPPKTKKVAKPKKPPLRVNVGQ